MFDGDRFSSVTFEPGIAELHAAAADEFPRARKQSSRFDVMSRSGEEYVRGLRDGRAVLFGGERVADVTVHPAFAGAVRTVATLYDLARDPANRELMTYPSPRDRRPVNKSWLVPRTREDLVARRRAIKFWADASFGFLGRSPDHVASFFAGFAGATAFYARGGQQFADNLSRFAARAADERNPSTISMAPSR